MLSAPPSTSSAEQAKPCAIVLIGTDYDLTSKMYAQALPLAELCIQRGLPTEILQFTHRDLFSGGEDMLGSFQTKYKHVFPIVQGDGFILADVYTRIGDFFGLKMATHQPTMQRAQSLRNDGYSVDMDFKIAEVASDDQRMNVYLPEWEEFELPVDASMLAPKLDGPLVLSSPRDLIALAHNQNADFPVVERPVVHHTSRFHWLSVVQVRNFFIFPAFPTVFRYLLAGFIPILDTMADLNVAPKPRVTCGTVDPVQKNSPLQVSLNDADKANEEGIVKGCITAASPEEDSKGEACAVWINRPEGETSGLPVELGPLPVNLISLVDILYYQKVILRHCSSTAQKNVATTIIKKIQDWVDGKSDHGFGSISQVLAARDLAAYHPSLELFHAEDDDL